MNLNEIEASEPARVGRSVSEPGQSHRRCLASGEVRPKAELIRFVVGPDALLVPDLAGKLPGRGLWLKPRRDMIEKAVSRRLFARAAKAPVQVPGDLAKLVESLLRRRCLELLGLARRAGQAVAGYEKTRAWLTAKRAALLLEAADGAEAGRQRLRAVAQGQREDLPVISLFNAAELGAALGRDIAVHVAVAPGGFAERLRQDAGRLASLLVEDASENGK